VVRLEQNGRDDAGSTAGRVVIGEAGLMMSIVSWWKASTTLCLDPDNQLFWDGKRIEVRQALTVCPRLQKALAAIVALLAVLGGLGGFVTGSNNTLCLRAFSSVSRPPKPTDSASTLIPAY